MAKPETIKAELADVSAELRDLDKARERVLAKRLRLLQQARQLDPPLSTYQLADACGVTPTAIKQQLARSA